MDASLPLASSSSPLLGTTSCTQKVKAFCTGIGPAACKCLKGVGSFAWNHKTEIVSAGMVGLGVAMMTSDKPALPDVAPVSELVGGIITTSTGVGLTVLKYAAKKCFGTPAEEVLNSESGNFVNFESTTTTDTTQAGTGDTGDTTTAAPPTTSGNISDEDD